MNNPLITASGHYIRSQLVTKPQLGNVNCQQTLPLKKRSAIHNAPLR